MRRGIREVRKKVREEPRLCMGPFQFRPKIWRIAGKAFAGYGGEILQCHIELPTQEIRDFLGEATGRRIGKDIEAVFFFAPFHDAERRMNHKYPLLRCHDYKGDALRFLAAHIFVALVRVMRFFHATQSMVVRTLFS